MGKRRSYVNLAAVAVIIILGILIVTNIYDCPLDYFLGIPCPLCGMSRAFLSLLRLDFADAFYYHPLWPVVVIVVIVLLLNWFHIIEASRKKANAAWIAVAVLFVLCFIIRHIYHSPIVEIHFEDSVACRYITMLGNLLPDVN